MLYNTDAFWFLRRLYDLCVHSAWVCSGVWTAKQVNSCRLVRIWRSVDWNPHTRLCRIALVEMHVAFQGQNEVHQKLSSHILLHASLSDTKSTAQHHSLHYWSTFWKNRLMQQCDRFMHSCRGSLIPNQSMDRVHLIATLPSEFSWLNSHATRPRIFHMRAADPR